MKYKNKPPTEKFLPRIKTRFNNCTNTYTAYASCWIPILGKTGKIKSLIEADGKSKHLARQSFKIKLFSLRYGKKS